MVKQNPAVYHTVTSKLLYLSKLARLDLPTSVAFLTMNVKSPYVSDRHETLRALRYLNATNTMGLTLKADKNIALIFSIDASLAVHKRKRSHTGALIFLGLVRST